jgi:hypothetical protein
MSTTVSKVKDWISKNMTDLLGPSWRSTLGGYLQFFVVALYHGYEALAGKPVTLRDIIEILVSAIFALVLKCVKDEKHIDVPQDVADAAKKKVVDELDKLIVPVPVIAAPVAAPTPPVPTPTPVPAPIVPPVIPPVAPSQIAPEPTPAVDRERCDKYTINFTFPAECAYVKGSAGRIPEDVTWEDVPSDTGGVTKWGIDQTSHQGVDIKNLTMQQALDIYYKEWLEQKINLLPSPVAECVHDTYESGGHAIKWLQEVLGNDLAADGVLGPKTLMAVHESDPVNTAKEFLVKRDAYFIELADTVAHDAKFKQGWLNRDNNLRKYLGLV